MEESTTSYPSPDTTNPDWQKTYGFKSNPPGFIVLDDDFDESSGETESSMSYVPQYLENIKTKNNILMGITIAMGILVGYLAVSCFFDQWRSGT